MTGFYDVLVLIAIPIIVAYYFATLVAAWRAHWRPLEQIFFAAGSVIVLVGVSLLVTPEFWSTLNGLKIILFGGAVAKVPKAWTWLTRREFLSLRRHRNTLYRHD